VVAHGDDLSVLAVRSLATLLERIGLDGVGLVAAAAISASDPPGRLVSGELVDRHLEECARKRRDPALAVTLAELPSPPFALVGQLVLLSRTIGDAIERGIQFWPLLTRRSVFELVQLPGNRCALRLRRVPRHSGGRILTEFALVSLVMRFRDATDGRFALTAASFDYHIDPAGKPSYERVFGARVAFGARHTQITFAKKHLALAIGTSDELTAATLETKARELVRPRSLLDDVRDAITTQLSRPTSLAGVARVLKLGERTLRRRLATQGTSLRVVADEVRREHAERLLAEGASWKQLAAELGFSDASALSRAYKRWKRRNERDAG
jgi:AraC-like DNA-binding protein